MVQSFSFRIQGENRLFKIEEWPKHRFGISVEKWKSLANKGFWITGAGTGYGKAITLSLAAAGSTVFMSGRRKSKLLDVIERGRALGIDVSKCIPLAADITSEKQIQQVIDEIATHPVALYGLVNNAALPQSGGSVTPLMDSTLEAWQAIMTTNITAQWLVTKNALPEMTKAGCGRIVFMSSEAGWAFTPGFGLYNISKAALNNLATSFATEFERAHPGMDIQINTLVPGEAYTEMNQCSSISPFSIVPMTLALLSYPEKGPNGCFFHKDGRSLSFAYAEQFPYPLI